MIDKEQLVDLALTALRESKSAHASWAMAAGVVSLAASAARIAAALEERGHLEPAVYTGHLRQTTTDPGNVVDLLTEDDLVAASEAAQDAYADSDDLSSGAAEAAARAAYRRSLSRSAAEAYRWTTTGRGDEAFRVAAERVAEQVSAAAHHGLVASHGRTTDELLACLLGGPEARRLPDPTAETRGVRRRQLIRAGVPFREVMVLVPEGHPHFGLLDGLAELATWLVDHPEAILPQEAGWWVWPVLAFSAEDGAVEVRRLADDLGVEVESLGPDTAGCSATRQFGRVRFGARYAPADFDDEQPATPGPEGTEGAVTALAPGDLTVWVQTMCRRVDGHRLVEAGQLESGTLCGRATGQQRWPGVMMTTEAAARVWQVDWCRRCWPNTAAAATGHTTTTTTAGGAR